MADTEELQQQLSAAGKMDRGTRIGKGTRLDRETRVERGARMERGTRMDRGIDRWERVGMRKRQVELEKTRN